MRLFMVLPLSAPLRRLLVRLTGDGTISLRGFQMAILCPEGAAFVERHLPSLTGEVEPESPLGLAIRSACHHDFPNVVGASQLRRREGWSEDDFAQEALSHALFRIRHGLGGNSHFIHYLHLYLDDPSVLRELTELMERAVLARELMADAAENHR